MKISVALTPKEIPMKFRIRATIALTLALSGLLGA